MTRFSGSLITVREGEAFNLLYALKWAQDQDHNLQNVKFDIDFKKVADAVITGSLPISEFGLIIQNCKDIISSCANFLVSFIAEKGIWWLTLNLGCHQIDLSMHLLSCPRFSQMNTFFFFIKLEMN